MIPKSNLTRITIKSRPKTGFSTLVRSLRWIMTSSGEKSVGNFLGVATYRFFPLRDDDLPNYSTRIFSSQNWRYSGLPRYSGMDGVIPPAPPSSFLKGPANICCMVCGTWWNSWIFSSEDTKASNELVNEHPQLGDTWPAAKSWISIGMPPLMAF